jgi:hypothetical protein
MALTFQPFAENSAIKDLGQKLYENVSRVERGVSCGLGLAALASLVGVRGLLPKAFFLGAGLALVFRGATGHCPVYEHLGIHGK